MNQLARTPKDIGTALRNARRDQKLSQQALATKSGVWQETISKIENGSPGTRMETIFDLFAALNLEIEITHRSKGDTDFLEDMGTHNKGEEDKT